MDNQALQLAGALGHDATDKRMDILRRIGEAGSISEAARGAGVSYKAAWQAIETLSNLAGVVLVDKAVGGSGGGGALLTSAGRQLLLAADMLARARADVLQQLAQGGAAQLAQGVAALGLRTSMRNQLPCQVQALLSCGAAMRVALLLADGSVLHARITQESAQLLGLHPGQPVLALCKATAVRVLSESQPREGENQLPGVVSRVAGVPDDGEVSLLLAGGLQLVGFVAGADVLREGEAVLAVVDESAVVVAVAA